jgi:hypothetical protein
MVDNDFDAVSYFDVFDRVLDEVVVNVVVISVVTVVVGIVIDLLVKYTEVQIPVEFCFVAQHLYFVDGSKFI